MKLTAYKSIYLIGIGGIGMSALARWFAWRGCQVSGYDRTPTHLTGELQAEGISIHFEDNVALIDDAFLLDKERTLVIYTPAVPSDTVELVYFLENGFTVLKRSQVLGMLTKDMPSVAVAGTHGKTTTSAMLAHIFHTAEVPCLAFVGGITKNYGTNLILPGAREDGQQTFAIVEADEYDRSFLQLHPDVAVFTSIDPDHLDIYGTPEEMVAAYGTFAGQVKLGGKRVVQYTHVEALGLQDAESDVITYGIENGHAKAVRLQTGADGTRFDLVSEDFALTGLHLPMPGLHNVENAVAAAVAAACMGIGAEEITQAINTFTGVQRRFDVLLNAPHAVLIDDYAHHPTEIQALLKSVRSIYPGRHVTAIFQPHLFSRTRDFADGFAQALSLADRVILADIYPARELPIPGITADTIGSRLTVADRHWSTLSAIPSLLHGLQTDVVLTIGAGDVNQILPALYKDLSKRAGVPASV